MSKLSATDAVQYLFDRPNEPSFNRKGANGGVQFQVPPSYVVSFIFNNVKRSVRIVF